MARYCHNCNKELNERSKFCRMCGTPSLSRSSDASAQHLNGSNGANGTNGTNVGAGLAGKFAQPADQLFDAPVPATEVLAPRSARAPQREVLRPPTAPTEPALLEKFHAQRNAQGDGADGNLD